MKSLGQAQTPLTKAQIRKRIFEILSERTPPKTMCPSEVLPENLKKNKSEMIRVRAVAVKLAMSGLIEITQKGEVVDPEFLRGPIRLRLVLK